MLPSIISFLSSCTKLSSRKCVRLSFGLLTIDCKKESVLLARMYKMPCLSCSGARFRPVKPFFRSSVSKNGEVYTLETSCMKGTALHL